MVKDDYYKQGLAINKSIDRQEKAEQLGLSFDLIFHNGAVKLTSRQNLEYPVLYLQLIHPMTEKRDTTLVLNRSEAEASYSAVTDSLLPVNYRVRIFPPDNSWELIDRWHPASEQQKHFKAQ